MNRVVFLVTKEHERKRETVDRQMQREEKASEEREREAHLERERVLRTPFPPSFPSHTRQSAAAAFE